MNRLRRINEAVAIWTTQRVGTMGCVWVFLVWSLLPAQWPALQGVVFYVSGGILQLVLLPLIMVGSSLLAADSERMRRQDHLALMAIVEALHARLPDPAANPGMGAGNAR